MKLLLESLRQNEAHQHGERHRWLQSVPCMRRARPISCKCATSARDRPKIAVIQRPPGLHATMLVTSHTHTHHTYHHPPHTLHTTTTPTLQIQEMQADVLRSETIHQLSAELMLVRINCDIEPTPSKEEVGGAV